MAINQLRAAGSATTGSETRIRFAFYCKSDCLLRTKSSSWWPDKERSATLATGRVVGALESFVTRRTKTMDNDKRAICFSV